MMPGSKVQKHGGTGAERIREYMYMSIKREEPTTTAIAAGDYEKNLSECHI